MKLTILVSAIALLVSTGAAVANDVQAVIECTHGSKAIRDGRSVALAGPLACSLRLTAYEDMNNVEADLWVTQDGATGEPRHFAGKLQLEGVHGVKTYFRLEEQPMRGKDFKGCTPFVVHSVITRAGNPIWSGEQTIKAKCGRPKKVKATFACGTNERCTVSVAAKQVKPDDRLFVTIRVAGSIWQTREALVLDNGVLRPAAALPLDGATACPTVIAEAVIFDQDDRPRWTGKTKIVRDCP